MCHLHLHACPHDCVLSLLDIYCILYILLWCIGHEIAIKNYQYRAQLDKVTSLTESSMVSRYIHLDYVCMYMYVNVCVRNVVLQHLHFIKPSFRFFFDVCVGYRNAWKLFIIILICSAAWIEIGGTTYKKGVFVVTASDILPRFSQIVDIVVLKEEKCFFICEPYETLGFYNHYHAYEVIKSSAPELNAIQQCDLADFYPLSFHSVSNSSYICMKYHIVEQY